MSKTLWRILSVTSKHALCNDSKRHVTLIAANHLIINLSVGTVPNAPIMIGTTVSFAQFLDPFQLPLQVLVVLILFYLEVKWTSKINNQGHLRSILSNTTISSFLSSVLLSVCILKSHSSSIHTVTLVIIIIVIIIIIIVITIISSTSSSSSSSSSSGSSSSISSSIVSLNTVFAGVLFVHQPGANHAPGASVTKDNHTVHYILWLSLLLLSLLALLKILARIFLFESITWIRMRILYVQGHSEHYAIWHHKASSCFSVRRQF